jgi:UDPglucose 6-dehydrogenase
MKLSVIGLGKLGSPLAAVLASKGFSVVGTDVNAANVSAINAARAPVDEPHLQALITRHAGRLSATLDPAAAVLASDLSFVIVPTPSDATGRFSNDYIVAAMESIGAALQRKQGPHVVAITSTVMPGSTGGDIREALERHSGRDVGPDLGLCYSPAFIALGSAVHDLLSPDLILIGESDPQAGNLLERVLRRCCDNEPVIRRMNFVNAELTKLSVNTFVTTKISYANMLADICDRLPGADVDTVTQAVGSDSRIGHKYLRGALGYGGPCFPRDNSAFTALARCVGARADLAEATDAINRYQIDRVVAAIDARVSRSDTVGVLGLSYKPDTAVVEQSQGVGVIERLQARGHHIVAYDPKATAAAQAALLQPFEAAESAEACIRSASAVVIMTPWQEFRELPASAFCRAAGRVTVIDCWRVVSPSVALVADIVYLGQGRSRDVSIVA